MVRQVSIGSFVFCAFLALCFLGTTSSLRAEPIPADDATATAPAKNPEVDEAMARFKDGDAQEALKLMKQAVAKNPDMPPAQIFLAQWCAQSNMGAYARNYLEQAVIESPGDPEAYVLMGDVALRDRRVTEADMLFQKALSVLPNLEKSPKRREVLEPRVLGGLAAVCESREDWAGAQKQLEAWVKLDPKSAEAMTRLAHSLFQQKNPDGALAKLKEAVAVNKDILTPEAILADFYERADDRDNATKWMIAALTVAPKDLNTRLVAAEWALNTGQIDEAKTQAEAAITLDPKNLRAQLLRGAVALFQKDYPTAERYFEAVWFQSPRTFAASNNLALASIEQKDDAKKRRALELAQNNVQQHQKDQYSAEAASTYGWVLYKMGKMDEAERALRAAVSSGNVNSDTAYYLARLDVDAGKNAEAKQLLEHALKAKSPFTMKAEAQELLDRLNK